jgi:hypothetical protein
LLKAIFLKYFFLLFTYLRYFSDPNSLWLTHVSVLITFVALGHTIPYFVFLFLSFCIYNSWCGRAESGGAEDCTSEGHAPGSGPGPPRWRAPGGSGHAQEPPGRLITCPPLSRIRTHRFVLLVNQISISTPNPKCRLYWFSIEFITVCRLYWFLIEFITVSHVGIFDPSCELPGTASAPVTFSLVHPPPPPFPV